MTSKNFELFIDESGSFKEDGKGKDSPSLVGGVLIEEGILDENLASCILGEKNVHSTEMKPSKYGKFAIEVLTKIKENGGELIVFQNKERLEIVDGETTYLNVLSEGIIQLIQTLSLEHDNFNLKITAAVRKDMELHYKSPAAIINIKEYVQRLEEKIILGLARKAITTKKRWKYTIELRSARKDKRLMISDVVCHSWFRKESKKFNEEQKEVLLNLYDDKYCFTVFEREAISTIKRYITEGNYGDAIFEIFTTDTNIDREYYLDTIVKKLNNLQELTCRIQLMDLINKIKTLISINRDIKKCEKLLKDIIADLIPKLSKNILYCTLFNYEIYNMLLEVANHQGNIYLAHEAILLCEHEIKIMPKSWENLDYYFKHRILKAVHSMNIFSFDKCIEEMTEVIKVMDDTMELFKLVDGLDDISETLKSEVKAKALGIRLQARCFLVRKDKSQLELAIRDSNEAQLQFTSKSDLNRQYQYRSQLECEAKNYDNSLKWLYKAFMEEEDYDIDKFFLVLINSSKIEFLFGLMHFSRIIGQASINGELVLASRLYNFIVKYNILEILDNDYIQNNGFKHPYEIIYWKLATYLITNDSTKAAIELYDKALKICNHNNNYITLKAIGLGILAEKASYLARNPKYYKEYENSLKELIKRYNELMINEVPNDIKLYFSKWSIVIEDIKKSNVKNHDEILLNLSKDICY